jgi:hypothetical protein
MKSNLTEANQLYFNDHSLPLKRSIKRRIMFGQSIPHTKCVIIVLSYTDYTLQIIPIIMLFALGLIF